MHHTFKPRGVCSTRIDFDITDGKVKNVKFTGGCNGNLKAVSALVDGMPAEKIALILRGNTCGFKNTSCADQFSVALTEALQKETALTN